MEPLSICSHIITGIKERITSPDFTRLYHPENRFVRKRRLSITQVITYLLYSSKASMSLNLANIRDDLVDFPDVSKQAVSKARNALSPELFRDLFRFSVGTFYSLANDRRSWHGYHLFAIDGSTIQVPKTARNDEHFGVCHNQHHTREDAMARISLLYDLSDDIIVDGIIQGYHQGERPAAREHLHYLESLDLSGETLVLFDRGYPSYDLYRHIGEKGYRYLMRIQGKVKSLTQADGPDAVIQYVPTDRKKEQPVAVRVIHVTLDDGTDECLVTNLFDPSITIEMFKELYFCRWGIESKYHELKVQLELEEFTGATPTSVEQDFYIKLLLMNVCALVKSASDTLIQKETSDHPNQYQYQANRAFIIGRMKKRWALMLYGEVGIPQGLGQLLDESRKRRSQIQPNRKCARPRIQLRRRHCKNRKTTT